MRFLLFLLITCSIATCANAQKDTLITPADSVASIRITDLQTAMKIVKKKATGEDCDKIAEAFNLVIAIRNERYKKKKK